MLTEPWKILIFQ